MPFLYYLFRPALFDYLLNSDLDPPEHSVLSISIYIACAFAYSFDYALFRYCCNILVSRNILKASVYLDFKPG